ASSSKRYNSSCGTKAEIKAKDLAGLVHLLAEIELKREEVDRIKFMNLVLENTLEMNGNDKNDIGIVVIKGIDTMHQRRRQKPTLGGSIHY
ncbi:hypothetical protein IFM89_018283, partial [Coptis chinensis]